MTMWRLMIFCGVLLALMPVSAQAAGERIAFVSHMGRGNNLRTTAQIYDFDSGVLTDVGDMQFKDVSDLSWSADGRLAFIGLSDDFEYAVYVWSGERIAITQGAYSYSDLTWNADGRLAFVGWNEDNVGDVLLWDGETLNTLCTKCSQPAWNVDGRLAFTSPDGAVYNFPCGDCGPLPPEDPSGIVVWDQGKTIAVVDPLTTGNSARSPRWLADGRLMFTLEDGDNRTLTAWDGSAMTPLRPAPAGTYYWSMDGNLALVSSPYGAGMINVDVMLHPLTDLNAASTSLVESAGAVDSVSWSHDGRLTFASDIDGKYAVYVWDGTNLIPVEPDLSYYKSPAWSADNRLAFVSDRDGASFDIYIWDGTTATRLIDLPDTDEDNPVWWTPPAK
jgi:WD40-like Beta Propeller Repeat